MAIQTINLGVVANDGTGDDLREAFLKVNNNFAELEARTPEATTAIPINRLIMSTTHNSFMKVDRLGR